MRVKKHLYTGNQHTKTIIFVYSGGKLIEEYATDPPTNPKTKYLTEDHLGTPRVITDGNGQVVSRRDFMPFGEQIANTTGTRSDNSFKYSSNEDDVQQKFTGYQQDGETMLDFAEARMYENRHARFTAVDPLLASENSANPQTFNRYVYVTNSPLILIDPTGLIGDYYDRKGKYLGTDGKNDQKVYLADEEGITRNRKGVIKKARGSKKLEVTHKLFKNLANIIKHEAGTNEIGEAKGIIHATNNRSKETNKTLLNQLKAYSTTPSSIKKGLLSEKNGKSKSNAARAGLIHLLSGGKDPTDGATFWDGTDFLAWGTSASMNSNYKIVNGRAHAKFREYYGIIIPIGVFTSYVASHLKYNKPTVRYDG